MTSIIVVCAHKLSYVQICIESIRAFTRQEYYELLVVCSESKSDCLEWLKLQQDIRLLPVKDTVSLWAGYNVGVQQAQGEYLVLMHSDIMVTPRWLEQLQLVMRTDSGIGMVGCVSNACGNGQSISVPYETVEDAIEFADGYNHTRPELWQKLLVLDGFCLLLKREVYREVGFLDEHLVSEFLGIEDYALRVRQADYRIVLAGDTFVHHFNAPFFVCDVPLEYDTLADRYNYALEHANHYFAHKWGVRGSHKKIDNVILEHSLDILPSDKILLVGAGNLGSLNSLFFLHSQFPELKMTYLTDSHIDEGILMNFVECVTCDDLDKVVISNQGYNRIFVLDSVCDKYLGKQVVCNLFGQIGEQAEYYLGNLVQTSCQMQDLDTNKICFITCVNDEAKYAEAKLSWQKLRIPTGMQVEFLAVYQAKSMCSGYQYGMQASDAKYKIYLHQDVFIQHPDFLCNLIQAFKQDQTYGMLGVIGCAQLPQSGFWWQTEEPVGAVWDNGKGYMAVKGNNVKADGILSAEGLDGLLLSTQYDLPWREDLFTSWHFYDISQCMEFRSHGYKVGIVPQDSAWVMHKCGVADTKGYWDARVDFCLHYADML